MPKAFPYTNGAQHLFIFSGSFQCLSRNKNRSPSIDRSWFQLPHAQPFRNRAAKWLCWHYNDCVYSEVQFSARQAQCVHVMGSVLLKAGHANLVHFASSNRHSTELYRCITRVVDIPSCFVPSVVQFWINRPRVLLSAPQITNQIQLSLRTYGVICVSQSTELCRNTLH